MSQPATRPTDRRRTDAPDAPAITMDLPRGWITRSSSGEGVLLVARPRLVGEVAPEVVVRTAPVATDLAAWREEAISDLARQLDAFELEDTDTYELAGHPVAYHRFAHEVGGVDVLAEQWAWLVEGLGVTLTGSVRRASWGDYCTVFEDIAGTVGFEAWRRADVSVRGDAPGSVRLGAARW